jgi:nicotinate phosphoribosyltransferase
MSSEASRGWFTSGPLVLHDAALFTDLYELTMAAVYHRRRMHQPATFSLFVRRLPPERAFLIAAGLEDVLEFIRTFGFSRESIKRLDSLGRFQNDFLDFLGGLGFTGEVHAVPEGTVLFADEPLLEVTAPMIEAQILETALINFCHCQTLIASKAARSVIAARGRPVAEFGLRRTPGTDAGLKSARSAFIAGCDLTSNVLAGTEYGIPVTGTMAHSYVTAFTREAESFEAFAESFPDSTVLLLDSYDTLAAAHKAVAVARRLAERGHRLAGVRLDSGDLATLSRKVREILDAAGFPGVQIFVSGGLDELAVEQLLSSGAPIDAFGIGTRMNVSADVPSLDMVYKLVGYAGRDVLKLSQGKETWVGAKALYRRRGADGRFEGDVLALRDEAPPDMAAESLLEPVMRGGHLLRAPPPLSQIRARCAAQMAALPEELKQLRSAGSYPVRVSDGLLARQEKAKERTSSQNVAVIPANTRRPITEPP